MKLVAPCKTLVMEMTSKPPVSTLCPLTHARYMHISYGKKNTSQVNKEKQHHPSCPCCSGNSKASFSSSSSSSAGDKKDKNVKAAKKSWFDYLYSSTAVKSAPGTATSPGGPVVTPSKDEELSYLGGTDPDLKDIIEGNRKWVEETNKNDPNFFKELGKPQTPKYFYVGCSDSRVDPLKLMGLEKGSVFIHRNVGNVVSPGDMNAHSALEFAVEHLKVPHIVVCGHYDCGAVRASLGDLSFTKPQLPPLVEHWTRNIRDVSRLYASELGALEDLNERNKRLVELNVIEQCLNILKVGFVQRKREKSRVDGRHYLLPRIHGLVFDPADGVLLKLNLNWKSDQEKNQLQRTFGLTSN